MIHNSSITRLLFLVLVLGVLKALPAYSQHGVWTKQDDFINITYVGVDAPDTLHCMALGSRNTSPKNIIRKTSDGGVTWVTILNADTTDKIDPTAIAYPTPTLAVFVGYNGAIRRSTDAGTTWATIPCDAIYDTNHVAPFYAISMYDSLYGVIGGYGAFLRTEDGGASWQRIPLPPGPKVAAFAVACLGPHTFVFDMAGAAGVDRSLFRTGDDGRTWTSVKMETYIFAMKFSDSLHGFATGYGNRKSSSGVNVRYDVILRTTDGGLSWSLVLDRERLPGLTGYNYLAVSPADRGNIIAMGTVPFQSSDSGRTWDQGPDLEPMYQVYGITDVTYPHKSRAWAVTRLTGQILRYDNTAVSSVSRNFTLLNDVGLNLAIAPMPVRDVMAVTFRLQQPEVCSIRLFDVVGRMVRSLDVGLQAPGTHSIQLQRGDLATGVYLLQVHTSKGSTTQSIFVQ